MRGAVTAGMCVALERAGLLPAFDRVYGCSSGALAGCYAAAGQAELWARSFEDAACRAFIDPRRALRRRPVLDLDFLFGTVCRSRRPLSPAGLAQGPELRTVAVTADTGAQRVLAGLADPADALAAVRASCTIPLVAGAPTPFRGELLVDGGLLEPIPFRAALREGATHVLVLRSRHAGWRAVDGARWPSARSVAPIPRSRPCSTRATPGTTRTRTRSPTPTTPRVVQVAPPAGARLVGRFSTDAPRIAHSVALGAACMARTLAGDPAPAPRQVPFPVVAPPAAPAPVGAAVAAP